MADVNEIVTGRTAQHKNFTFADRAKVSQDIKGVMGLAPGWESLTDSQKEALEMIAHKTARIIAGNPEHIDSWADIAGYAVLIQKELEGTPVDAPTPTPVAPVVTPVVAPVVAPVVTPVVAPVAPRPVVPPVVPAAPVVPPVVPVVPPTPKAT